MNHRQMMLAHLQNQSMSIQRQIQEAQKATGFSLKETGVYVSNDDHHKKSEGDIFVPFSEVGVDASHVKVGSEARGNHLKAVQNYFSKRTEKRIRGA